MLVLSGFILYGKEFIIFWAGQGYDEAYYVTLLLIIPVSVPLCQTLGVDIQQAMNKHKYRSVVYAIISIGNVLISIPLSMKFGAVGAAIGTAIGLIVGNGMAMNIIYEKIVGLDIINFWKNIIGVFKAIVIPVIIGILMKHLVPVQTFMMLIIEGTVFTIIYFVSVYCISMNNEEKNMINNLFKSIRK